MYRGLTDTVKDPFSADTSGLADATPTETVELADGASFDLKAGPVRKRLANAEVKMRAYNGSIPGPTLKIAQGAEVTINFTNEADVDPGRR
jgi:FtsP/CotA-like multicopper oxidase with cupredoxin domain